MANPASSWMPRSPWRSTSARRFRQRRTRPRTSDGAVDALGRGARATPGSLATGIRAVRHCPGRGIPVAPRRLGRCTDRDQASRVTRSAAWPLARDRPPMLSRCSTSPCRSPARRTPALPHGRRHARTTCWRAVARGIDMFDCVMPTRAGRTARAYTSRGVFNLAQRPVRRRPGGPLDPAVRLHRCAAGTCARLSASSVSRG